MPLTALPPIFVWTTGTEKLGQAGTDPSALTVKLSRLLSELRAGKGPQPGSPSPGKHSPVSCADYSPATKAEHKKEETIGLSQPATLKGLWCKDIE